MQYTCDALLAGPNLDNVSFSFDLAGKTTQMSNPLNTSMEEKEESYINKKLILIVNYRRFYMVGFALSSNHNNLIIVDYVKQTFFYQDDLKAIFLIPFGEFLAKAINLVLS